jgi:dolichyl-diphosphooligosaccharide--protein glycosyltransferase
MDAKRVIGLGAVFGVVLFIACFFNWSSAVSGRSLGGGPDPWYHLRVVEHIMENGGNLRWDPLLNYPFGWHNPRPIGFTFTAAIFARLFQPLFGSAEESAIAVLNVLPAFFGALCIFPVYFIAEKRGKKEGILAAIFLAITAIHISTSSVGSADYDSFNLFFGLMAIMFYARAISGLNVREADTEDFLPDIRSIAREERGAMISAVLSGVFLGILAMSWEGFVYVDLILFLYLLVVQLTDHVRRKSSTRISLLTVTSFLVGSLISAPYYMTIARKDAWLISVVVLLAAIAASLIFIALRKVPWLLLFPGSVALLILGFVVLYFVMPDIAQLIITGWGYFSGNPVYRTIAEAQPPNVGYIAFSLGPATFFMAFIALVPLVRDVWKKWDLYSMFILVWFLLATFMASSALRFIFNAGPIYAVMNGIVLAYILSFADLGSVRETFSRTRRSGFFSAIRRSIKIRQVLLVLLVVFVIFLPNAFLAVDAGSSREWEQEHKSWYTDKFMGAFGSSLMSSQESEGYSALAGFAEKYEEPSSIEKRPAVASWWDYGFYNIQIGKHPTCADPFQNGYFWASRFFLSQNETHALQMLAARLLSQEYEDLAPISRTEGISLLKEAGIENAEEAYGSLISYEYTPYISEEQAIELLALIKEETGKSIEYALTTNAEIGIGTGGYISVEKSYPIVKLSGFNESDFIHTWYSIVVPGSGFAYVTKEPWMQTYNTITDASGSMPVLSEDEALRYVRENRKEGYATQPALMTVTDDYINSTLYRLCIGYPPIKEQGMEDYIRLQARTPAYGMKHFKAIFDNGYVTVFHYYPGAVLEGTIYGSNGSPMAGANVEVRDEKGVMHDSVQADSNGRFSLTAPEGDLTVAVTQNGGVISESRVNVSFEQAMERSSIKTDVHIEAKELKGTLSGTAFMDENSNGVLDEGETAAGNATVLVSGAQQQMPTFAKTDANGRMALTLDVGTYMITVISGDYIGQSYAVIDAGKTSEVRVPAIYSPEYAQQLQSLGGISQLSEQTVPA